jgi:hypothetical protein
MVVVMSHAISPSTPVLGSFDDGLATKSFKCNGGVARGRQAFGPANCFDWLESRGILGSG